jgi:WD40 repeat protein
MLAPIYRKPSPWLRSLGRARQGYGEALVHPDGRRVIAIEHDGTATVWDLTDGRQLLHLPAMLSAFEIEEARGVYLRLHPDAVRLFATVVIVDTSDVAHCWNIDTGALIDRYEYPRIPSAFAGDRHGVTAHGLYLTLWDLETGATIRELRREDASWRLFGMLGEHALVRGRNAIELWHLREGRLRWSVPASEARAAAVAGDAVVIAGPGRLVLRDVDGTQRRQLPCAALVRHDEPWTMRVDSSATTAVIAGAADMLLAIDLATGDIRSRFPQPTYAELEVAGRAAIVSAPSRGSAVWALDTGACRLRVPGQLALSPDGETAVSCDGAHLRLWAVDGSDHTAAPPAWIELAVPNVPDMIVALDRKNHVHVTDRDGALRHSWGPARARAVLDGAHLAHAMDETIIVLDGMTGEHVRTIEAPTPVDRIMLSGGIVGAVMKGGIVQLWRIADAALLATFETRDEHPRILAIDSTRVAVAAGTTVELWRIEEPQRLHTFRSLTTPHCAAFDPTGRWLVTGHPDGALLVRDTLVRTHRATLESTMTGLCRLVIRGNAVAICGAGGVAVWSLDSSSCVGAWDEEDVLDVKWLDDRTLACANERGLVLLSLR